MARPGWQAPIPVLCCGNVTVGGAGKTTVALEFGRRLLARGVAVHFLTRGYGGRVTGPLLVDPACHDAALVGDEPLLLARLAPCWVARDRATGARQAVAAGAACLVMDDGLQNPGLVKTASVLVVDGATGFGNGRLLPAGPLRENVANASARCRAAVLIGLDTNGAVDLLPAELPVLRARLEQDAPWLDGARVLAFAGIAHPGKFWATLRAAGAELVGTRAFPDHHPYRRGEIQALLDEADILGVVAVTTPKDAVRLPHDLRALVQVAGVMLRWDDEPAVDRLLDVLMG